MHSTQLFSKTYGNAISPNTDLNQFASFILKHDFKSVRINANHRVNYPKGRQEMSQNHVFNEIPQNYDKLPESRKFKLLTDKFGIEEVIKDWLIVLPTYKKLYETLKKLPEEFKIQLLKDIENP